MTRGRRSTRSARAGARRRLGVHLKVDTGMHRVGAAPADVAGARRAHRRRAPRLRLAGVFTHLAVADEPDDPYTAGQLDRFDDVLAALPAGRARRRRRARRQLGRRARPSGAPGARSCAPGIAHVRHLARRRRRRPRRRPAAGAVAAGRVSFVKRLAAGERLSYGLRHTFAARRQRGHRAARLRRRRARGLSTNGDVLIGGRRRPIVGSGHDGPADGRLRRRRRAARRRGRADRCAGRRAHHGRGVGRPLGTIGYEIVCGIGAACAPSAGRGSPGRPARNIDASCRRRPASRCASSSLDGTHAVAAAIAGLSRSPATSSCWPARWAPARRRSPRASGGPSASPSRSPRRRSRWCTATTPADATLHHADLYRLEQLAEVADLALAELAEYDGIVLVEWGDVVESTFGEHLLVRLDLVDGDLDARDVTITAVGPTWASGGPRRSARRTRRAGADVQLDGAPC